MKRILEMLYEGPYEDENGKPEAKVLLASPVLVFINAVRIDRHSMNCQVRLSVVCCFDDFSLSAHPVAFMSSRVVLEK